MEIFTNNNITVLTFTNIDEFLSIKNKLRENFFRFAPSDWQIFRGNAIIVTTEIWDIAIKELTKSE